MSIKVLLKLHQKLKAKIAAYIKAENQKISDAQKEITKSRKNIQEAEQLL